MVSRFGFYLFTFAFCLSAAAAGGCRQRMADQPYYRPYEPSDSFADGRSARPLERGVIHRGQRLEADPLVTGLTQDEWKRAYELDLPPKTDTAKAEGDQAVLRAVGSPRFDPKDKSKPQVYVTEFPFPIDQAALKRGQERYSIYCAVCHGPLGNGQGKIWERGYLNPTSFHTTKVDASEADVSNPQGLGVSRGYSRWGIDVKMPDAPVGYYFEVITKGFGGMPSYSAQIPPADRWKIIAYVRALQYSQGAKPPGGGKP